MTPEEFYQGQIKQHNENMKQTRTKIPSEVTRVRNAATGEVKTITITRKQLKDALMHSVYLERRFCPSQQVGGVTASTWDHLLELQDEPQKG